MSEKKPKLTIVIPHYNGLKILDDCLTSLFKNHFQDFLVLLIDNGSTDGSQQMVRQKFPKVQLIQNEQNLGYAGACNQGIELAKSEFILLLNNDTVCPTDFLKEMVRAMEQNSHAAMAQPKILSIQDPQFFDYSGGAGGEMDILGYPFARGRIFDTVEKDKGQYDQLTPQVFWTSGCALLLRKSVVDQIGLLDEDFFAHQEEIDLNWRAQLAGYQNIVVTSTYIYHYSGYTLRQDNQHKMYLNHRNNLIMLIKNYSLNNLLLILPLRILFEMATVVADSILWEGKRGKAVLHALFDIFRHPIKIWKKRHAVQRLRKVSDRAILKNMYPSSVVIDHFVRKYLPYQCVKKFRK
ncbi:MAG: glycosyltransferase family 2 protein [Caldisericaceae bacterium]|nr:glycosyltransferase family 2 protein [Caldisericaceae bacterium]